MNIETIRRTALKFQFICACFQKGESANVGVSNNVESPTQTQ